jgi:hypothetical protein
LQHLINRAGNIIPFGRKVGELGVSVGILQIQRPFIREPIIARDLNAAPLRCATGLRIAGIANKQEFAVELELPNSNRGIGGNNGKYTSE